METSDWMGKSGFYWFVGIIQDIDDPLSCGRVRIRCFGWHSDNINELPVGNLPWAQVMLPVTSASTSSIGRSPTGLLNGSFVVGFFLDGEIAQQPVVIGSLHGIPERSSNAFSDPDGVYPSNPGYPDTPNLAYDRYIEDKITIDKEAGVVEGIPTASKHRASSVSLDQGEEEYELKTWDELPPRNGKSPLYPKNHVTQTESGHAIEIDDTPDCERIHTYHRTGTFSEIQNTGNRMTKVVANDFEIVVENKNVLISGNCNITVSGNARIYVEKDCIQEIGGNYHLTVHGDMITKIGGNDVKEVIGDRSHQINGNETRRVSGNRDFIVAKKLTESVGSDMQVTVTGNKEQIIAGKSTYATAKNTNISSGGSVNIGAGENLAMASAAVTTIVGSTRIDLNP